MLSMTQMLSLVLGVLALFLLVYGLCVRSKTVGLAGAVLTLAGAYLVYYAWWGEQFALRM